MAINQFTYLFITLLIALELIIVIVNVREISILGINTKQIRSLGNTGFSEMTSLTSSVRVIFHSMNNHFFRLNRTLISSQHLMSDIGVVLEKTLLYSFNSSLQPTFTSVKHWLQYIQNRILTMSTTHLWRVISLNHPDNASLLAAMVAGNDEQLTDLMKQLIKVMGIQHLLVVSGFHLGMVLMVVNLWSAPIKTTTTRSLLNTCMLVWYSVCIGLTVSLTRALIMAGIRLWSRPLFRLSVPWWRLLLAACTLIFIDPAVVQSLSFQLSITATAVIVYVYPALPIASWLAKKSRFWRNGELVLIGAVVQLFLSPLLVWHFGTISLLSPIVSALVTPLLLLVFQLSLWLWLGLILISPFKLDSQLLAVLHPLLELIMSILRHILIYFGQFNSMLVVIPHPARAIVTLVLFLCTWGNFIFITIYQQLKGKYAT